MSRENVEKINKKQSVSSAELTAAATFSGVATTEQGRPRDLHSIAADLGRVLKQTITISQ